MALQHKAGASVSPGFQEQVKSIRQGDLDRLSERVNQRMGKEEFDVRDWAWAYGKLLEWASKQRDEHWLVLKFLKDQAKAALMSQGAVVPGTDPTQAVQHVLYWSGAWQALTAVANMLSERGIEEAIENIRKAQQAGQQPTR